MQMVYQIGTDRVTKNMWELQLSRMSHDPGDQNSASNLSMKYRELSKGFENKLKLLEGEISLNDYIKYTEMEDGVMREIND